LPAGRSHTFSVLSSLDVTRRLPSMLKAVLALFVARLLRQRQRPSSDVVGGVRAVALSGDCRRGLVGGEDGGVVLLDPAAGRIRLPGWKSARPGA